MNNDNLKLTPEELQLGWHFCWDWDGLLVGPGMGELDSCTCHPKPPGWEPSKPKQLTDHNNIFTL